MADGSTKAAPQTQSGSAAALSTCPVCGLGCDDLSVRAGSIDARGCGIAERFFARPTEDAPHLIDGTPASLAAASARAATLLRASRRPWFGNVSADLAGIQAVLALADRTGGIVDHKAPAVLANYGIVQSKGWMTTTFSEVANRADVVVILGQEPSANFPRLYERLLRNPRALYRTAAPEIYLIGPAIDRPLDACITRHIIVPADEMLGQIAALTAAVDAVPRRGAAPTADGISFVADRLKAASYGVVVWDAGALTPHHPDLAIELLVDLIRRLNRETRCSGLPLGGRDNGGGLIQALTWQSGFPSRVCYTPEGPKHDPQLYGGKRGAALGEIDLAVWVAGIEAVPPPPMTCPVIAIAPADLAIPGAAVTLRVGIAGIDCPGNIVRSDSVVMLPLQTVVETNRLAVAAVARAILSSLDQGDAA